jgi:hypothetical protein
MYVRTVMEMGRFEFAYVDFLSVLLETFQE